MRDEIKIKAHAKINLTLDVTGVRENGYHDLKMVMQEISLADMLTVRRIPEYNIRFSMNCELPDKIPPEKNLVYKAAAKMQELFPECGGFDIYLEKEIPAAAGLAGGSSDCAATLKAINEICGLGLSQDKLCDIGVMLGADVPFCICGGTMLSEGIGEILTPLKKFPHVSCLLVKPDISVSTKDVYNEIDSMEIKKHPDTERMLDAINRRDAADAAKNLSNVLEEVTIPKYPVIAEIKEYLLNNGAAGSLMSGSGPTVFGIFQDEIMATMAYRAAFKKYPNFDVILCRI